MSSCRLRGSAVFIIIFEQISNIFPHTSISIVDTIEIELNWICLHEKLLS